MSIRRRRKRIGDIKNGSLCPRSTKVTPCCSHVRATWYTGIGSRGHRAGSQNALENLPLQIGQHGDRNRNLAIAQQVPVVATTATYRIPRSDHVVNRDLEKIRQCQFALGRQNARCHDHDVIPFEINPLSAISLQTAGI